MLRKILTVLTILVGAITLSGCALLVGGAAVGAGAAGSYVYANGEMTTDYPVPLNDAWNAVEKTVADMRGTDIERVREIAKGSIKAFLNQDKVTINVLYKGPNATTVGIRVGVLGDKLASQMLHDKISAYLTKR